jgi:hypothetical protein
MLIACLKFMSADDINKMLEDNGFGEGYAEAQGDPSESDEWQSYDPDC